jgi:hypothetical protein
MDINEVRSEKIIAEAKIEKILMDFSEKTGTSVISCTVDTVGRNDGKTVINFVHVGILI